MKKQPTLISVGIAIVLIVGIGVFAMFMALGGEKAMLSTTNTAQNPNFVANSNDGKIADAINTSTETSEEDVKTRTYRSEKLGVEFEYPESWVCGSDWFVGCVETKYSEARQEADIVKFGSFGPMQFTINFFDGEKSEAEIKDMLFASETQKDPSGNFGSITRYPIAGTIAVRSDFKEGAGFFAETGYAPFYDATQIAFNTKDRTVIIHIRYGFSGKTEVVDRILLSMKIE